MFFSFVFVSMFFFIVIICYDIPSLKNLETSTRRSSVVFEAYDGTVIATYGDLFEKMVTVEQLPKHVYQAIIAIEDRRFFHHIGFDLFGIIRAAYNNTFNKGNRLHGGSTITQQLAKNIFLTPSQSIKRKVQELVLSLMIEHQFSKAQILTIYLNRIYFGSGAYGIDAAAFRLFGKRAKNLSLYESAKLAACLKSPSAYSPISNQQRSDERTVLVLNAMYECGYISKNDLEQCITTVESGGYVADITSDNRYFTDWLLSKIPNMCLSHEDIIVRTTLDVRLQNNAVVNVRRALINKGIKNSVGQMALIALDSTGAVRAMVGGHTYGQSQYNRCLATRSSGSAFKFFTYLAAFECGMNPSDKISDCPVSFRGWSPKNYHWKSRGELTLNDAFAFSVNTSAVRLAMQIGRKRIVQLARNAGYSGELPGDWTFVLGTGGTNLLELASCYGCILSNGQKVEPYGIISIRTKNGKMLYKSKKVMARVVNSDSCSKMKTIMRSVVKYGTGKRSIVDTYSYGKTGTSNDSIDAWYIGMFDNLVVGVWCGNDDNKPMSKKITGGTLPAETWKSYVESIMYGKDLSDEINSIKVTDTTHLRLKNSLTNFIKTLK